MVKSLLNLPVFALLGGCPGFKCHFWRESLCLDDGGLAKKGLWETNLPLANRFSCRTHDRTPAKID